MYTARGDGYLNELLKNIHFNMEGNKHTYKVIHNSLTHLIKSIHLNGGMNLNMLPTDGQRNSPSFFSRISYMLSV
jgi:hypothetical protein